MGAQTGEMAVGFRGFRRPFGAARPHAVTSFRAEPDSARTNRPTRQQAGALLAVLLLVSTAIAVASLLVRPSHARTFDLVHGSVFIADQVAPVGIDLASGKPTLRLVGADRQVGTTDPANLSLTPVHGGTVLLNPKSGEFNMVDQTGFVIKHDGGGVLLTKRTDQTRSAAVASQGDDTPGATFIERTGPSGTNVFLVNERTVETASLGHQVLQSRASRTMREPALMGPGGAASGNRDLWLLMGAGNRHTIRQLRLPNGGRAGVGLLATDHGDVNGAAAIGTVPISDDTNAVGIASSNKIQIYGPAGHHIVGFSPVPGLDRVVPVSSTTNRLAFLMHGSNGWSIASVKADGNDRRGPIRISSMPASADLAPPAFSNHGCYTIDRNNGHIYWIDIDGKSAPVSGAVSYPLARRGGKVAEASTFTDAYVLARGTRVLVNSPLHTQALAVFTDGSRRPFTIQKSAAVDVSAEGGAEALTRNPNPATRQPNKPGSKTKPVPGQAVNNRIDCKTATQKPHIPLLQPPSAGSRSIGLSWTYPLLDSQDCAPTTYQVSVKTLSASAPTAPATTTVQGQQSVTLTGLYPSTQYEITVTAYLNGQGTTSPPIRVTTGVQGPEAPTNVSAVADNAGNWQVSWSGCGTAKQGCVPADTWQVIPSFCDGRGLSAAPSPLNVAADPSSVAQPPATYRGSDDLLGRGLQFLVQGTGASGQSGTPSARSACVFSHGPPDSSAMNLSASAPAHTTLGAAAATTVTLNLGDNPVRAVGGVGAQVTFQLSGGGETRTRGPIAFDGASTLSANFDNVRAGSSYTATATVQAPHGGGTTTLTTQGISTRADWPSTGLTASCPSDGSTSLSCTLHVGFTGISSSAASGETFDFHGRLLCGNTGADIDDTNFDPADHQITVSGLSQLNGFHGDCTANGTLSEHAPGANAVFGGTTTSPSGASIDLGTAQTGDPDFSVKWDDSSAIARIHSGNSSPLFGKLTTNWSERVHAPDGTVCGENDDPVTPNGSVSVPQSCVNSFGDQTGWRVDVSYTETVTGAQHGTTLKIDGTPPGYLACAPAGFAASWGATQADGVLVSYNGDTNKLPGCSNFTYVLMDTSGTECGHADNVDPANQVTVTPTCDVTDGWTVAIRWHNNDTGNDDAVKPDLALGSPPTS